jgi:uncharacterized pyridoxamine 5'-phosphate oxidase family protein
VGKPGNIVSQPCFLKVGKPKKQCFLDFHDVIVLNAFTRGQPRVLAFQAEFQNGGSFYDFT